MSALQETMPSTSETELGAEVFEKVLNFPLGIPGFPNAHRFILTQTEKERPFAWLRSVDQESTAFAVVEAYRLVPDYSIDISDDELAEIGSPTPQECAILLILRIEVGETVKIYANLRAPVVLNMTRRQARQIILSDADHYSESTLFEFGVKK